MSCIAQPETELEKKSRAYVSKAERPSFSAKQTTMEAMMPRELKR
jgi:hypothetical protein